MNQVYASQAIIDDGSPPPGAGIDLELHYVPTTRPGARLPHVWIFDRKGQQHSTLDITGHGAFTVLTGIGGEAWAEAAREEARRRDMSISAHVIGPRRDYEDLTGDWARLREISDSGCLLVRPDHHVAWRQLHLDPDPIKALSKALDTILGT